MRKISSLCTVLMLFGTLAFAQTRTVAGVITNEDGLPIPFASITEQGASNGVIADENGKFSFNVKEGAKLTITATGYLPQTVSIATAAHVTLSRINEQLAEVVVTTAFGIKRSERVTPYSTQVINSDQLNIARQPNLNNALAGKIAGIQFRGQSAANLDREAFIRIRGGQSLTDRGAIYVVDGTILDGGFDLNPDDIESLNVLKGANATALFGARAANGAIVITTKKRSGNKGIGVELNQGITVDRVYVLPKYQNEYAGGDGDFIIFNWNSSMPAEWQALDGKVHHDFTDDASWGPKMEGQEYIPWYAFIPGHNRSGQTAKLSPQPNNAKDFWNTGVTSNTNVNLSKAGQGYNLRLSLSNQHVDGLLPNSSSNKNTVFTSLSYDLSSKLTAGINVTYTTQKIKGYFDDTYANASSGNFNQWFHRDLDMNILKELRNLKTPIGTMATWNFRRNPNAFSASNPRNSVWGANYWYNQYNNYDLINNAFTRDRLFGDASVTYKVSNNFRIKGTIRKSQLNRYYENITPSILEFTGVQTGVLASYATGQRLDQEYSYELLGSYNQAFGDLVISANAGAVKFTYRRKDVTANTNGGLNVTDLYAISNSKTPPSIGNFRNNYDVNSIFGTGDFEYKRFVSLSWTLRNDWYSTLPKKDNNLFVPSLGASFIFSEFTKNSLPWLSYGKVFGSWGRKPLPLNPYELDLTYSVNQFLWNGNFLMTTPDVLPDPNLTGSLVTTYETGVDLRFLKNRLGINVTYYYENNDKEPLTVALSGISGFTGKRINIAQIIRQGLEVELNAIPVTNKNFQWNVTSNFAYILDNKVKKLAPGVPSFTLSGGAFGTRFARAFQIEGEQWGTLMGGGIKRNDAGLPLITTNLFSGGPGWFVGDETKNWGSIVPKVTGGLQNTFAYKNWNIGFNIDYQVGGKFFSLSEQWGTFSGLLENTAGLNDKGKPVRDPVSQGGGVHVKGVNAVDGRTPVDVYIDAYDYFHQFYFQKVAEPFIHDLTYVKLREVALGYTIPVKNFGALGKSLQGANISLIARNPLLIYRKTDNFDPSEISYNYGEEGQLPGTRSLGLNLKLNF